MEMNKEVKADLYDFLQWNETGMFVKNNELFAYVHVHFSDLAQFAKIVGSHTFDDGGLEIRMFERTMAIDLNDIIEGDGHELLAYRACFDESDVDDYMPQLQARLMS